MCSNKASWVGGMVSSVLVPFVNMRCRASLTLAWPLPLLYIKITNRSNSCMWLDCILSRCGLCVKTTRVSEKPGIFAQAAKALFFPHPIKWDVVSHPITTWNKGTAKDVEGPRCWHTSWTGMSRYLFPLPNPTQSCNNGSVGKNGTARITTSLSTVRMSAIPWPWAAAFYKCRMSGVSASEWLHGWSSDTS